MNAAVKPRPRLDWAQLLKVLRPSTRLDLVLILKLVMTIVWVVCLLAWGWSFGIGGVPKPEASIFVTLLAGAYIALFVGYALGYWYNKHGRNIWNVVVVGIVSNGLAALFLAAFGISGGWNSWGALGQWGMWISAGIAGLITIGLIVEMPDRPDFSSAGS